MANKELQETQGSSQVWQGLPPQNPANVSDPYNRFKTVTRFSQAYPDFPIGGLRHIIFHAETNGFAKAIKRIGRKVLIDVPVFFQCLEEQNGGAK